MQYKINKIRGDGKKKKRSGSKCRTDDGRRRRSENTHPGALFRVGWVSNEVSLRRCCARDDGRAFILCSLVDERQRAVKESTKTRSTTYNTATARHIPQCLLPGHRTGLTERRMRNNAMVT